MGSDLLQAARRPLGAAFWGKVAEFIKSAFPWWRCSSLLPEGPPPPVLPSRKTRNPSGRLPVPPLPSHLSYGGHPTPMATRVPCGPCGRSPVHRGTTEPSGRRAPGGPRCSPSVEAAGGRPEAWNSVPKVSHPGRVGTPSSPRAPGWAGQGPHTWARPLPAQPTESRGKGPSTAQTRTPKEGSPTALGAP